MLAQAASPLSIPILFLDPSDSCPAKQAIAPSLLPLSTLTPHQPLLHQTGSYSSSESIFEFAKTVDVLTVEIEHVDAAALERVERELATQGGRSGKGVKVFPAARIIKIIQDKYSQKDYLAKRGIAVAPFEVITCEDPASTSTESLIPSILSAGEKFGYPLMLKSRHLAYDGKGNHVLESPTLADVRAALAALIPASSVSSSNKPISSRLYAEKFAPFVKEVAVMVVRGADGKTRTYPAVETIHRKSVCHIVYAPLRPPQGDQNGVGRTQRGLGGHHDKDVAVRASEDAGKAVAALGEGAVGVFGVEMFLMADGELLLPAWRFEILTWKESD